MMTAGFAAQTEGYLRGGNKRCLRRAGCGAFILRKGPRDLRSPNREEMKRQAHAAVPQALGAGRSAPRPAPGRTKAPLARPDGRGRPGGRPAAGGPGRGPHLRPPRSPTTPPAPRCGQAGRGRRHLPAAAAGAESAGAPRHPPAPSPVRDRSRRPLLTPALGRAPQELAAVRVVDELPPLGHALPERLLCLLGHGGAASRARSV